MPRFSRSQVVQGALGVFAALLVIRAAQVQLWEGRDWAARAHKQHYGAKEIPAPRGSLLDAHGVPLAQSRELIKLAIAPREVRDRRALGKSLRQLGVPPSWVTRATDARRKWVTLPGRYLPVDAADVTAMRGVYSEAALDRVYAHGEAMRRVVGRVGSGGEPIDGLELALDSLLRGKEGTLLIARDARGRRAMAPEESGRAPERGHEVVLTLSRALQDIAEQALEGAVSHMGAAGGDVVILDPHSGEIRALASHRTDGSFSGVPALSEPFEPGSTLKPFFAAALLGAGLAEPNERMDTENGVLTLEGRTITDVHRESSMTLEDVIRHSSNVGIVKFTQRLTPRAQYEVLRDLGFGTPTGVPFPSEAGGTLTPPDGWSRLSSASLAMGYEIAVTPVQLAAAYAAIANGGELLEPTIVREIREPNGDVRFRHERRVIRRVMREDIALTVRGMLAGAVEDGTGEKAALGTFSVAGKTGTARVARGGRYAASEYTASFVGFFPADDPQYVVLVKIDRPTGAYYGGQTAAPVARAVLEAAIAARDAALDRRALASRESLEAARRAGLLAEDLAEAERVVAEQPPAHLVELPLSRTHRVARGTPRAVPNVRGMHIREAVHTLHRAGFRVHVRAPTGSAATTWPHAGAMLREGSLVRLVSER
ncbi:MAG: penicillin-binding transpeptidase domain-containing protein [Gemmatimonadaceae bacterium]